jgi:HAD superfamily hydrolase (TIGR01549 family)
VAGQEPLIEAVVFDVGETLVDETRLWSEWADWLGVRRSTFFAVLGASIARGEDHRAPLRMFAPDVALRDAVTQRLAAGEAVFPTSDDLYADVIPALEAVAAEGYLVGLVGNQPTEIEAMLGGLDLRLALVASSTSLGVEKPDPAFFGAVADRLGLPPAAVVYVGDRVDNDVRPAVAAGMRSVFLRRGPWAWIQAGRSDPPEADAVIESLADLPDALERRLGKPPDGRT